MEEDKIQDILKRADYSAPKPNVTHVNVTRIYRRAAFRQHVKRTAAVAASVIILAVVFVQFWPQQNTALKPGPPNNKESVEEKIQALSQKVDAALERIDQMMEEQRRADQFKMLQAELDELSKPIQGVQEQVEDTAFILVYRADVDFKAGRRSQAIKTYKKVIEQFPDTKSAQDARKRLEEIENKRNRI
jgi:TolA-binding protein